MSKGALHLLLSHAVSPSSQPTRACLPREEKNSLKYRAEWGGRDVSVEILTNGLKSQQSSFWESGMNVVFHYLIPLSNRSSLRRQGSFGVAARFPTGTRISIRVGIPHSCISYASPNRSLPQFTLAEAGAGMNGARCEHWNTSSQLQGYTLPANKKAAPKGGFKNHISLSLARIEFDDQIWLHNNRVWDFVKARNAHICRFHRFGVNIDIFRKIALCAL